MNSQTTLPTRTQPEQKAKPQAEYALFTSNGWAMGHFFNAKRTQFLEQVPPSHPLHKRVMTAQSGYRREPFPPSAWPVQVRTPEELAAEKTSRVNKKHPTTLSDAQKWLRRGLLIDMWNKDVKGREEVRERGRAVPKMKKLAGEFGLVEGKGNAK